MLRPAAVLLSISCLLPVSAPAQGPAHREHDSSSSSSTSSSSSSHRVVVVNGKTVVDEHIVDGKRVPADRRMDPDPTVEDMMRRMQEWLRQHGADPGGHGSTSSSSHRVVVVDGKKVVDERKADGKPVPAGHDAADPDGMLRELQERLRRESPPPANGSDRRAGGAQHPEGRGLRPRDPVKPASDRSSW